MLTRAGTLALGLLLLCGLAWAEPEGPAAGRLDWPQWQGPTRQANCAETGLLKSWPKAGPKLVWQADGLGKGFSTPSIAAGRIYGMSHRDNNDGVWCLDEKNGKELWFTRIGPAAKVDYGGSRCTPTVDGNRLYALTVGGELACLDSQSGKLIWKKDLKSDFGGRMMSGWGFSESPLVDGDKLICAPGNPQAAVVALDKATGDPIWKAAIPDCGGAAYASIVATEGGGTRHYVAFLGKCLAGVDADSGKLLWRYDRVANKVANCSTPIVKDDMVFASSAYNTGSVLLRLTKKNGGVEAKPAYFLDARTFQNHHGGVVLVGNHFYGGHGQNAGTLKCINAKTGKIAWEERAPASGSAAVLYADGRLIYRYQDGTMVLVEANPNACKIVSKFKLPYDSGQPSWPHPVIANGKLYIREMDALMCFDVKAE